VTGTEKLLLIAGLAAAAAAILYWHASAPPTGGDALLRLAGLPDPRTVPVGTTMNVGNVNYTVTQSRMAGSQPRWEASGYGGGVPGMIT
jgi:hypothetical protein